MKLPNAQAATVPESKVERSLLNLADPAGGSKATFFLWFGFTVAEWTRVADALLQHARDHDVVETGETWHGVRFAINGPLVAPDGAVLNERSA